MTEETMMQDEQLQQMRRRQEEGMRAMSDEHMARLQREWAEGARQRGPLTADEQASMRNTWGNASDACCNGDCDQSHQCPARKAILRPPGSDHDEHGFAREGLIILAISAGSALGVAGLVWAVGEVARRLFG